ncbi:hypothetical protein NUU61_009512 [Penicillium alfredii]|uniref:Vacuolar protein sorting-associated protein 17 n=1 Tax=Penicillium alfredii TaxID=1506179 RepID=A0A9W9EN75_9EURO|nr:uncharacterized protein NUU61_009512 [Penicillium alfredii]KAJ5084933.1 hypothetical protein NUU61_009512 [Penicillium alfredii]
MDYSAISHDPDHPTDASPWDSPRADRTTFPTSNNDIPSSPLPGHENSVEETDRSNEGEARSPGLSAQLQSAQIGDSGYTEPPPICCSALPSGTTAALTSARTISDCDKPNSSSIRSDLQDSGENYRSGKDREEGSDPALRCPHHLISANPEALVPAVPPPVTPAGAGTDEDELRVKAAMQRWLNVVLSNEVLIQDDEVVLFVESDFGYSPMLRMKQPATGVRRKMLKQFAPPPDDTPELQAARPAVKMLYLGTMDSSHKVDRVVKARRGLGLAESDFGVKLGQMHVQETHPGLGAAYRKLGKIIQTMGDYHAIQATAEATTLGEPLSYHSSDAFIVKETLTNRHILLRDLLQAQQSARNKRAAADRLKVSSSVRPDKVDEAINALEEAQNHEDYLTKRTHRVTNNLVHEKRRWFDRTTNDLLFSLREYTLRQIEAERRTLATLESVRPDIRSIDASGGLSRLGRESHPSTRRLNLSSSQGPKGDAWSGVPRRNDNLGRSLSGSFAAPVVPEDEPEEAPGQGKGCGRSTSQAGSIAEDDDDRLDARNAASRLATSTF